MNLIEIITSNAFVLMSSLVAIMFISAFIGIFERKGATFGRNALYVALFCVFFIPVCLYPTTMTGVMYQLICSIIGAFIGCNVPNKWVSIKQ